jgi:hypothetical protein
MSYLTICLINIWAFTKQIFITLLPNIVKRDDFIIFISFFILTIFEF